MNIKSQKIVILGAGGSGRAAARLALTMGGDVYLFDSGEINNTDEIPAGINTCDHAGQEVGNQTHCDLLIISPGIDTYGDYVAAFSKHAGEVIGEVEFATRFYTGKIIAITGTNGKTTTTELIELLVNENGYSCVACGNYGVAVSDVVNQVEPPQVLALEISSFQLETIKHFCPDVAVWLNFDADHMDRYRTLEEYRKAKLRIFENQNTSHKAIIRKGEDITTEASQVNFSASAEAEYYLEGKLIKMAGKTLIDITETKLRGKHNAENVMAAIAAVDALDIEVETATLKEFTPPSHRCQLVKTIDRVEFINDSKATNLHALDSALNALTPPLILIAGGKNKGLNYRALNSSLKTIVKKAFVIGEISEQLVNEFPPECKTERCENIDEAVEKAHNIALSGECILFSPGTSSFDMFNGYIERGNAFIEAVEKITLKKTP